MHLDVLLAAPEAADLIQALRQNGYSARRASAALGLGHHATLTRRILRLLPAGAEYTAIVEELKRRDGVPGAAVASAPPVARVADAPASPPVDLAAFSAALKSLAALPEHRELLGRLLGGQAATEAVVAALAPSQDNEVPEKPVARGTIESPDARIVKVRGSRFVVTWAQNNTHVHKDFLSALKVYCDHNRAELLIARGTYNKSAYDNKKSTRLGTKFDDDIWYDPEILPYQCDDTVQLASGLLFLGRLDILPTATDPLSGLDSHSRHCSAIVAHPKLALKSLATMKHEPAKLLYTTGAVTQRNYVERKAGQLAAVHHTFGALAVEVDRDGDWFVRQLVADETGGFQDLDLVYSPSGVRHSDVEAINWGDLHREKMDPEVFAACWSSNRSIIDTLRPRHQFIHDLLDFQARNHHNRQDPYFLAEMHFRKTASVEGNIAMSAQLLTEIERPFCRTIVVESNHDQAFRRWLCEADIRNDPENARYYHYWSWRMYEAIERNDRDFMVFEAAIREKARLASTTFLREDQSFVICEDVGGIECGMHGHRGTNGARGNPRGYRGLGRRCNTGHTHSAQILEGVYTAGVSGQLDMGYNVGPSSWSHSHIITYRNGQRAILTMRGSKWRAASIAAGVRAA